MSAAPWAPGPATGGCGRRWNGYPEEPSPSPLTPKPPAAGEPAAKVAVDQEEYNFGKMAFGSEMSHDFKFTSAGRAPLGTDGRSDHLPLHGE